MRNNCSNISTSCLWNRWLIVYGKPTGSTGWNFARKKVIVLYVSFIGSWKPLQGILMLLLWMLSWGAYWQLLTLYMPAIASQNCTICKRRNFHSIWPLSAKHNNQDSLQVFSIYYIISSIELVVMCLLMLFVIIILGYEFLSFFKIYFSQNYVLNYWQVLSSK